MRSSFSLGGRSGCRFRHSDADDRPWSEIRTEWQRERSAKRHAARQSARMAGVDGLAHESRAAWGVKRRGEERREGGNVKRKAFVAKGKPKKSKKMESW